MRILFFCLALYGILIIFSGFASAALPNTLPSTPTGPWTTEAPDRIGASCSASAVYSNGTNITFSSVQGELLQMSIKGHLTKKFTGLVGLGLGDNSYALPAERQGDVVTAHLASLRGVGKAILNQGVFRVRFGAEDYYFETKGFGEAYNHLTRCGSTSLPAVTSYVQKPKELSVHALPDHPSHVSKENHLGVVAQAAAVPPAYALLPMETTDTFAAELSSVKPVESLAAAPAVATVSEPAATVHDDMPEKQYYPPIKEGHKWSADKGEALSVVLTRWAREAGVNAEINLGNDPVLQEDFVAIGAFEVVVYGLLNDKALQGTIRPSAVLQRGDDVVTDVAEYEAGVMAQPLPEQAKNWRVLQGADLRKILQRWCAEAGVDLVWNTPRRFFVPRTETQTVDFAEAVGKVLEQFQKHPVRPIAVLNTDPDTGRTALIIQTEEKQQAAR